ncbi:Rrf2 family transcriptional regulator [Oscillatoriales cyanobacterium LEGE 11467]|uniref:Rrf2 family transcriptional regulator n=1 Tax=Zarconia navalis LEGE 11467 TaxID=1828826 RepID=A0A928Z9P2_9CYAN|nr:Rrf2 family transcriptional regulator [Zarconia navalis]MBE9040961.1 Rrf2 family transcriptional regulator [Zarconia navalis LEGE 11467]
MELSCKSEYAMLALLALANHYTQGEPRQIRQIATEQQIPDRYLEQLLATLRRGGLVRSERGAKGGYLLAREPWKVTLLEIVECIEGLKTRSSATKSSPKTIESAIVREIWQEVRQTTHSVLQKYTLQDLKEQRDAKQQLNIMYYI